MFKCSQLFDERLSWFSNKIMGLGKACDAKARSLKFAITCRGRLTAMCSFLLPSHGDKVSRNWIIHIYRSSQGSTGLSVVILYECQKPSCYSGKIRREWFILVSHFEMRFRLHDFSQNLDLTQKWGHFSHVDTPCLWMISGGAVPYG